MQITKRGKFLIFAAVIFTTAAWVSSIPAIYIAPCFSISLLILEYFFACTLRFGLNIERILPKDAYEDDEIDVKLSVYNASIFDRLYLEIDDQFTPEQEARQCKKITILGVSKRSRFECGYRAACYKRGFYNIGPCKIILATPLRFFIVSKTYDVISKLIVYPKLFKVKYFPLYIKGTLPRFGEQTSRLSGDYEEFYGVREYHREDGWRRIHWRTTARIGELMVKHFEQSALCEFTLLIDGKNGHDLGQGKETTLEYAVRIAASISDFLTNKKILVQLIAGTKKPVIIPLGKGHQHFMRILEELAGVQCNGDLHMDELINLHNSFISANSTLVVFMHDNDLKTLDALMQFRNKSVSIVPIVFDTQSFMKAQNVKTVRDYNISLFGALRDFETKFYLIKQGDSLELKFL